MHTGKPGLSTLLVKSGVQNRWELQFRYLHIDNFRRQLDYFQGEYDFLTQQAFSQALQGGDMVQDAIVLTFDDGLRDHLGFVLPELLARGLWGIFYIPVGQHLDSKLLDVHRIHLLLGRFGGKDVLSHLERCIDPTMLLESRSTELEKLTYPNQSNDQSTLAVKRLLNYHIDSSCRSGLLDRLVAALGFKEPTVSEFYMEPDEIVEMQSAGMWIGAHSVSHSVLSKLSLDEQAYEIDESLRLLESWTNGLTVRTFGYPYGRRYTFTNQTKHLVDRAQCHFTFAVESRDIDAVDLVKPHSLPRYDCNEFPFGKAS